MNEPSRDLPELDGEALAMLAEYRDEERAPDELRARVWTRVGQSIDVPVVAKGGTEEVVERADRTRRAQRGQRGQRAWIAGLAAAAAVVLTVVGLSSEPLEALQGEAAQPGAGAFEHQAESSTPEASSNPVERSSTSRRTAGVADHQEAEAQPHEAPATEDGSPVEPPVEAQPSESIGRRPDKRQRHGKKADPSVQPPTAETLATETRLLERAQAALASGNADEALDIIATSFRRFPDPVLGPERAALHAVALCQAGRSQEGREAARAFVAKYPSSGLRGRVKSACGS